jgi:hypothetical protein
MGILQNVLDPRRWMHTVWQRHPFGPYRRRVAFDLFARPSYAFGLYHAATLARALGVPRISAIEFGVGGGVGLVALEEIANATAREFKLDISVYGFDSGKGLPSPSGYKDIPYMWSEGFYSMDVDKLRSRLSSAKLILGSIDDTIPDFLSAEIPPIGFISFDLDYYSSTMSAFRIFEGADHTRLPRVFCYFDDVIQPDWAAYNEFAGELLAIDDFNKSHEELKIAKMRGIALQRPFPALWNEKMYVAHDFRHRDYGTNIQPESMKQLPLQ